MCRSCGYRVGTVSNLFDFVWGISGVVGWFCGLADPQIDAFYDSFDHSEHL